MAGKQAKSENNQSIVSQLTKKQKEAIANLEQSIVTLNKSQIELKKPNTKCKKDAVNQLGILIAIAEKTLDNCRNNPTAVNLGEIKTAVSEALPALKHYPHKNEALYNFGIMMAGFLLVLPGILYVGLAVQNYKQTNRFWLFEFGPTAYLQTHARELRDAVEQFVKPDEVKEARYSDGVLSVC